MTPYALSNLEDGHEPSARAIADPSEAMPGEVVVEEAPHGKVWDASNGTIREPTEAERLKQAKGAKVEEFHARAVDELGAVLPRGRDELQAVHNATLMAICEALGIPLDERMRRVDEVQRKAFAKKAGVEAATTPEELEGISWTP